MGLTPRKTSLFVSKLPLRIRFGLLVAAIVASVICALWWFSLRMGERQGEATFWFALSGVLLVTRISGLLLSAIAVQLVADSALAFSRQT